MNQSGSSVRTVVFLGIAGVMLASIACSAAGGSTPAVATTGGAGSFNPQGVGGAFDPNNLPTAGNGGGSNETDVLQANGHMLLKGLVRDFHSDFPDMEPCTHDPSNKVCDIGDANIEQNKTPSNPSRDCTKPGTIKVSGASVTYPSTCIVNTTLEDTRIPTYAGPAGGTFTTTGAENFAWWFKTDDSGTVNLPQEVALDLAPNGDSTFTFDNTAFFPIDGALFGNEGENHNYHFTTEFHINFTYQPGQTFYFKGDDDLWVFIDGKLAVDRAGIHNAQEATLNLDDLGLTPARDYQFDLFYCERHKTASNLKITTSMKFTASVIIN